MCLSVCPNYNTFQAGTGASHPPPWELPEGSHASQTLRQLIELEVYMLRNSFLFTGNLAYYCYNIAYD